MDIAKLRTELTTDPESIGYSPDDSTAASQLNASDRQYKVPIESRVLLAWSGNSQRLKKVEEAALAHVSADVQNVSKVVLPMLNRSDTSLDLNQPGHAALVNTLIAGGVLASGDMAELEALATMTQSRADELGLGKVRASDVMKARA